MREVLVTVTFQHTDWETEKNEAILRDGKKTFKVLYKKLIPASCPF